MSQIHVLQAFEVVLIFTFVGYLAYFWIKVRMKDKAILAISNKINLKGYILIKPLYMEILEMQSGKLLSIQTIGEENFRHTTTYWHRVNTDTSYYCYDSLVRYCKVSQIRNQILDERVKEKMFRFIIGKYDDESGAFAQNEYRVPDVYATYCAIKDILDLVKHRINGISDENVTGMEILSDILGKNRLNRIFDFLIKSQDDSGGFHQNPLKKGVPTVSATSTILRLSSSLNGKNCDGIECILGKDVTSKALSFLVDMSLQTIKMKNSEEMVGFRSSPDKTEPWSCSTFFAAKGIESLGQLVSVVDKHHDKIIRNTS